MLILHCAFKRYFYVWAETQSSGEAEGDRHPGAASGEKALSALETAGLTSAERTPSDMSIPLPTAAGAPIHSTKLLYTEDGQELVPDAEMRKWTVPTVPMTVTDMIEIAEIVPGEARITEFGCLLSHGVMVGLDMLWVTECVRFASSLLDGGHFLPDVREIKSSKGELRYESVWRPLLMGDNAERFDTLVSVMPEVVRAAAGSRARPRDVLMSILETVIDGAVREQWSEKRDDGIGARRTAASVLAERKSRGRLVSALNPHALWASSLGWLGETEGLSVSLETIYEDVRSWWKRFEWYASAPFKLIVSLSEEPDKDGLWHLDYSLKLLTNGDIIPAEYVWTAGDLRSKKLQGSYMRRYMLLLLGRVGACVPEVMESLSALAPTGCMMTTQGASDLLSFRAASIESMGVDVAYPSWWRESSADRLTLRGRRIAGEVDPIVFAYTAWSEQQKSDDAKLSFVWELVLDGELLTPGESRKLRADESSLLKIRDKWIFIGRPEVDRAIKHSEGLPIRMTAAEAVRLAVRDPYVDGFIDAPDIDIVYRTLRGGDARVSLGAPAKMHGTLRPYQLKGYSWMAFLTSLGFGVCLADDMGLGKTVQTLALIQHHRDMGDKRPVLLVCPTSVLENWRVEMSRFFPGMNGYVHHGRTRARDDDFSRASAGAEIVMTSYSVLTRDAAFMSKIDWVGIVLDEGQNIKNPDTQQSRICRQLRSEWRVVLTGTPIENHVGDLWSVMEFLMPGMLGPRRRFRAEYVKPIQETRDRALMESLRRQVSPLILRRMKSDKDIAPELPEKIETKVFCTLKREQAQLYTEAASALTEEISGADGIKRRGVILAALTKLKQICDHPSLATGDADWAPERSAKLDRLLALTEEMDAEGGKALIFTQYVGMGRILKTQLQERFGEEVLFLHGGVAKEARDEMIRRFQLAGGPRFFVLSLRAGGLGLNLTGASHVVMYDRWWNPAVENQAIDRAYRIGQTKNVQVHIFCCSGTLEDRIDEMLASKKELASSLIDETDESWVTELSDTELRRLIALSPNAVDA